jgi:hypothetical protein
MRNPSRFGAAASAEQRPERSDPPPTTEEVPLPRPDARPASERIREALQRWLEEEM